MNKEQKSNYCSECGDFHDPFREYRSSVRVGETVPDYEFESYHKDEVRSMKFSGHRLSRQN